MVDLDGLSELFEHSDIQAYYEKEFRITFAYTIFYEDELLMFQCDQKPQQ